MMLTVFTPTYNRSAYLQRLYESLLVQECRDFEWLVVDDGSEDDTATVVQGMIDEGELTIRYYRKVNGGKHTAYNEGLLQARGAWFLCVDADDYLENGAVERIAETVRGLSENEGIAAYKQDTQGKRLSGEFPPDIRSCKISELTFKYGCSGEFTFIFPTALAQRYPFPVFPGERFVGECVVYDRIEKECGVYLLPCTVTVCEYLESGYSQNFGQLMAHSPSGFCLFFLQRIDLMPSFAQRLSCAAKYWCFRWISKKPELRYEGKRKLVTYCSIPIGLLFRIYYWCVRGF